MRSHYAEQTNVNVHQTRDQIEDILTRHGAKNISGTLTDSTPPTYTLICKLEGRYLRFVLPFPVYDDYEVHHTASGRMRDYHKDRKEVLKQITRQRWRVFYLTIKAQLEAIASGIITVDEMFLGNLITGSGRTIYQDISDQLPKLTDERNMRDVALLSSGEVGILP